MAGALDAVDIETVLDDVVEQFADPYAFFRELVQNAIDAGTGRVEIWFEHEPGAGDADGRATIHVRDWGEGMDRQIIEQELFRLFHSGKAEDYTQIGRFGIGFVSIFAIDPDVVCVDTGRSGEYWRVLVEEIPDYELVELDRPLEGTHVRLFKSVDAEEFRSLVERSQRAIREWCHHAEVPILVGGKEIRDPFEVEAECTVEGSGPGTRMVAGLRDERRAPYGYYNSGLTLEEGVGEWWPHVAYKVDSRYLEHTVARDGVVEDENFHKAEAHLESLVREKLPRRLIEELESETDRMDDGEASARYHRLVALLEAYLAEYGSMPDGWRRRKLFAAASGEALAVSDLVAAAEEQRLYVAADGDVAGAYDSELVVLRAGADGGGVEAILERLVDAPVRRLRDRVLRLEPASSDRAAGARRLCEELEALFRESAGAPAAVALAHVEESSPVAGEVGFVVDSPERPVPIGDLRRPTLENTAGARLWLNAGHRVLERAVRVAESEPAWAAYNLAKVLVAGAVDAERDRAWLRRVVARRNGERR